MRKIYFDRMSMMSSEGWLGGSDKSSGKLLKQKIEFGLKFDIKIPRCARGLYHLIEIWGGRFGENWRFQEEKIEFGLPFYITYTNSGGDVDENGCFT